MERSDLQSGHLVELSDGDLMIVIINSDFRSLKSSNDEWMNLNSLDKNMIDQDDGTCTIEKVYKTNHQMNLLSFNPDDYELIWSREEEIIELTIDEIAEKYGKEPSQIKIKK